MDALERGPIDLIVDPALSVNNPDNPKHTAGTKFMGPYMDHDIIFDLSSRLGQATPPRRATNPPVPAFDLDSTCCRGPVGDPQLYDPQDRIKRKVESGCLFEDLSRGHHNTAIIADPRNEENLIHAGLHGVFLTLHNRAVDGVRARDPSATPEEVFEDARRLTTWQYQWMIVHEFHPLFVGETLVADILRRGRRFDRPEEGEALIPVEFQGAPYRFGRSIVRPCYRANLAGDPGGPFFEFIFDPTQARQPDPGDLRGGARAPRRLIGWQTFLDFGDGQVKRTKKIDAKISTPPFNLPRATIPGLVGQISLPQRNLVRHLIWQLPSGQASGAVSARHN